MVRLGIIGGSGLEKLQLFTDVEEITVETPFGSPSSSLFLGRIAGKEVYILSRHGRNHQIPPTQVNNLANIAALKQLGCEAILAGQCGESYTHTGAGDPGIIILFYSLFYNLIECLMDSCPDIKLCQFVVGSCRIDTV